jgi:hypothetical protein
MVRISVEAIARQGRPRRGTERIFTELKQALDPLQLLVPGILI